MGLITENISIWNIYEKHIISILSSIGEEVLSFCLKKVTQEHMRKD